METATNLNKDVNPIVHWMNHISPIPDHIREFYNKDSITMNKLGYRSDEFEDRKEVNLLVVGDSVSLGWGVKDHEVCCRIFAKKLSESISKSVAVWNLSMGGKSNDYISRMLLCGLKALKPDICMITFTEITRREYFGPSWDTRGMSGVCDYIPSQKPNEMHRRAYESFFSLSCFHDDINNFYKNCQLIEFALETNNVPWMFSTPAWEFPPDLPLGPEHVGIFGYEDFADDDKHPGPQSHMRMAQIFLNKYLTML